MRADRNMIMSFVGGRRKRRALLAAAASAVALLATFELTIAPSAWAIAAHNGDDMFSNLQTVSDEKLAQERGKFVAGPFSINLGAMITTLVNGRVALQSNFTWDGGGFAPKGVPTGFLVNPPNGEPPNGHFTVTNGDASSTQFSDQGGNGNTNGVTGHTFANGQIVQIQDGIGKTVLTSVLTSTGAVNLLSNNANNHSATQQVQFAVTINNFSQFQQQVIVSHIVNSLRGGLKGF